MKSFNLFLPLAFLCTVKTQRTPTISYISQEQIKDIGETVEFRCSVQYAPDFPVVWTKINKDVVNDQLPLSHGSSLIVRDTRFSLKYVDALSTFILQIKDIQETDAGIYQCKILISLNNHVSANVELQVRRPPIISDNSTRSLVVTEGQPVQLECYAGGFPAPRISWRRENNAILPTGGSIYRGNTLKIPAIRKEDRGTYYCVAENGVGRGARRNINVEVEFAPVITAPRPRLGQALQYDMDLECHVEAYPPPAISWLKDDVQLSNNQHYSISHFATADQYTDTTIRVITIEKRQYGQYVCRAANKLGTAETRVELFEISTPNINYPGLRWASASRCSFSIWLPMPEFEPSRTLHPNDRTPAQECSDHGHPVSPRKGPFDPVRLTARVYGTGTPQRLTVQATRDTGPQLFSPPGTRA